MESATKDMRRDEVHTEIFNYIERKRSNINEGFMGMEIDRMEKEKQWHQIEPGWSWYPTNVPERTKLFPAEGKRLPEKRRRNDTVW